MIDKEFGKRDYKILSGILFGLLMGVSMIFLIVAGNLAFNQVDDEYFDKYYTASEHLRTIADDYCESEFGQKYEYKYTLPVEAAFGDNETLNKVTCYASNETYPDAFNDIEIGDRNRG